MKKTEKAAFGAGCFWHVEEEFSKLKGVIKTTVGYMGGTVKNPTYKQVCNDKTGHAEVCQVEYNPKEISYKELLDAFWRIHDPTQYNRQGPDVGSQYKSVIFYHDEEQKEIAEKSKEEQQKRHNGMIVTKIESAKEFWKAEEYHQKYFQKNKIFKCG